MSVNFGTHIQDLSFKSLLEDTSDPPDGYLAPDVGHDLLANPHALSAMDKRLEE